MAKFPRRRPKNGTTPIAKAPRRTPFARFARKKAERTGEPRPRSRGIYLLPNAFTTGALFCGFYAIVMAMNQRFEHAAWAIFVAMLLDGLDGRVARLTNTQSEFGAQYDSLSDMVSFGAAPALVIYEWSLRGLGKLGWIAAFVYCAGAALRLARFNTNIAVVDKRYFQGMPSPSAAALVAGLVLMMVDLDVKGTDMPWFSWGIALFAGLTMVTNVPFYSFKDVNFRKSVPFITVFLIALAFALVSLDPPKVMFPLFVLYGLSGYLVFFARLAKGKPVSIVQVDEEPEEDEGR
ncbi:CDP-diacylglycerol--serine O-phosphatidyltransferase [Pseudoduganella flava]|uniref:CDP-diacylglycerol--serine O-phosphatidyltransferase n=1 Tax=Pseudoduganella flava TaxID=871742 RepID=A0A562PG33_9BURK|nr:CDP-diacylglycerol--serine O-phosphatidyltransferase [Pseudoduganella flava]QGZ38875.1 CDP-diacylglycerol--serine O-phosphatidyltransferase [Pseudoduganella flava]TWI42946.1 CDP-diacylglycerol--serine O-phosphatidyltransferase [Pseudoduganella flava]